MFFVTDRRKMTDYMKMVTKLLLMQNLTRQIFFMPTAKKVFRLFFGRQGNFSPLALGLTFCLFPGLTGCDRKNFSGMNAIGANITPIRGLQAQQQNTTVYIQGKVAKQAPLLQKRLYQLDDSTGKIWVLTSETNWQEGQQVVVKGKLNYKNITLAGKELGEIYVEEK
jgi:uncharacterized protein YdeI (BOF family)